MGKIDNKVRRLVEERKAGCIGNTYTTVEDGIVRVFLHGNKIYMRDYNTNTEYFSLCGWDTPTTKRRLNNLLLNGYIKTKNYTPAFYRYNKKVMDIDKYKNYVITESGIV